MSENILASWNNGTVRDRILRFVEDTVTGPTAAPVEERIAVFDNDGTLCTEKPMPPQLHFLLEQWRQRADDDPELRAEQPYLAASEGDLAWIADALARHHDGDDADLRRLMRAILGGLAGRSVEDYGGEVARFYEKARHPTAGVPYRDTVYQPMRELLRYLEEHEFSCYIVTGSDRDFLRPISVAHYGLPADRIIGSAVGLAYDEQTNELRYTDAFDYFDDGPEKPVRIWSRLGRRPLLAVGNSDGDLPMLRFVSEDRASLSMLIHHDDHRGRGDEPYDAGAEQALIDATHEGYTVVSVERDWNTVFPTADVRAP